MKRVKCVVGFLVVMFVLVLITDIFCGLIFPSQTYNSTVVPGGYHSGKARHVYKVQTPSGEHYHVTHNFFPEYWVGDKVVLRVWNTPFFNINLWSKFY